MENLFIIIIGLVIGSFLGAYTYRWPKGISISKGRSFCPKCKAKISWYDNIPVLSYLILGGKCRNCKKKISLRYPLTEFSTVIIFVFIFNSMGGVFNSGVLITAYYLLLAAILIAIFIIDLENKLIPDEAVFLILILAFSDLILSSNQKFYEIVFTAFAASSFFLLLNLVTKGRGMGLGDVKLVLALSLIFKDWKSVIVFIFLSFIIGAVIGIILIILGKAKFGRQIPFGPFIIASFFITLLGGDLLIKYILPY